MSRPLIWLGPSPNPLAVNLRCWRAQDERRSFVIVHDWKRDEWAASVKVGGAPALVFPEEAHDLEACKALCERKRLQ